MIAHVLVPALLGVFSWTFFEYVLHRWMGHDRRFRRTAFGQEHLRHHVEGGYFAPAWKKGVAAAVTTALLSVPAILLAGAASGLSFVFGLMAMYGAYETLHRLEHTREASGPYGRWARRHHFTHHYVDARCNHGVTSPLWDFVFRTYRRPAPFTVPRRLRTEARS